MLLGVGDDCALLQPPTGQQLAMTMDTLISGRHFFPDVDPVNLGHKALAVNLSDLAAMGAKPAWALLSLSLPDIDHAWLKGFVKGFQSLARIFDVSLVGGDTCQGPLSITVQLSGFVESDRSLQRAKAQPGDLVYVTGKLGDAALALQLMQAGQSPGRLRDALERPEPRISEGRALLQVGVRCAIDISDGLSADLGHICDASGCAARIDLSQLPLSDEVAAYVKQKQDWTPVVAGGDDYELCFTVSRKNQSKLLALPFDCSCIGEILPGKNVELINSDGSVLPPLKSWEHFS